MLTCDARDYACCSPSALRLGGVGEFRLNYFLEFALNETLSLGALLRQNGVPLFLRARPVSFLTMTWAACGPLTHPRAHIIVVFDIYLQIKIDPCWRALSHAL
jgi:hypothetical protein